jgi:hypothetical protein
MGGWVCTILWRRRRARALAANAFWRLAAAAMSFSASLNKRNFRHLEIDAAFAAYRGDAGISTRRLRLEAAKVFSYKRATIIRL